MKYMLGQPGSTYNVTNFVFVDIDECEDNNGDCEQTCDNSDGGYSCRCNTGYTLDPSDSQTCNDIDECQDEVTACGTQVDQCQNNDGSYTCTCQTGYAPGEILVTWFLSECENLNFYGQFSDICSRNLGSKQPA